MLVGRGARAGRGMPRGWTALCLLSLLPSGFTNTENTTAVTTESSPQEITSTVFANVSNQEATTLSPLGSTALYLVSQDNNGTTATISETTVNITSTSEITPVPGTTSSSVQSQTSLAITVTSIPTNFSTSDMTLKPSLLPGNVLDPPYNSTSLVTSPTEHSTSFSLTPSTIRGEIKCSQVKEVKLTQGICLELNETYSCEDFKKDNEEELTQVLCEKEQAEAGAGVCSLLLAQSEVKPHCLLLVLANRTELSRKLQLLKKHQSDLKNLGIQGFTEQDVGSHQSYSRKTLIALVTSGILLAVLGTTGYFLMNRRSWSPTGERLGEDPYYTENGGGQGYSSGPGASPEAQGKASVNRGAQENGTGQATSRNGHSARQHVVADTEL
ncbi:hematopoietic progenitor cell antigen CD34 isoform X1 [Halichoerus grypus]|uniref:hematopoietic progenitor cell antigen CD34 isoform X1 n=1 Tax=Phoca vitulina TaxID=9720 RepID=UPI0013961290|nr:hematopoietic progenitor cell antigen CD34 isoform X1 [Phoca vitulina]XP_035950481.1 hematopoietic progenitor cell antigen CD34 isoform X1 [Halichoerus grypus]XP_035950489.1 hematopoietic progenitor cell antigen CD34 isoform X1 [Halichoerus grypus]